MQPSSLVSYARAQLTIDQIQSIVSLSLIIIIALTNIIYFYGKFKKRTK